MYSAPSILRTRKQRKMFLTKKLKFSFQGFCLITFISLMFFSCSDRTKIACAGDSITYGYGLKNPNNQSYPAVLDTKLGNEYKVKNFGHSGATALKQSDLPYRTVPEMKQLERFQPDIVILLLGSNDAKNYNWPGRGIFQQDFEALVLKLAALKSQPDIYLVTPPPAFSDPDVINNDTIVEQIIPVIKMTAAKLNLPVIDFYTAFKDNPQLFPDDIHPNEEAAAQMADMVYDVLAGK